MIPRMTQQVQSREPEKSNTNIWQENVTGVNGSLVQVRGTWISASNIPLEVGDTVYVEWQAGKPFRVVDFEVRRGRAQPVGALAAKGIVEQLFIAPSSAPGSKPTIWFRNHNQLTELVYDGPAGTRLFSDWANAPEDVFWGVNVDHFAVLEGTGNNAVFHVYRIIRQQNLDKILSSKVRVKEKIYSVKLSEMPGFDLTTVTVNIDRDSVETYVELFWFAAGAPGDPFNYDHSTLVRDPATNENIASVSRTLTIRLTGTAISFVNGSPIAASEIVVPSGIPPTSHAASLVPGSYMLDANNDIIYAVSVNFVDFGLWQGNSSTGLTGSYHAKGEGTLTNAGVCFVIACPYIVDDLGIQDFMDHGNPSGIVSTHITETHSVLINARSKTVVFSTFAPTVTLALEETSDGVDPYRLVKMDPMPVITSQCYQANTWSPTPGLHGIIAVENYGSVGDVGLLKSERSLFKQTLPFTPDLPMGNDPTPGTPTRTATIRVTVQGSGYDREWTDTFGQICGAFAAVPFAVEAHWSAESVGVFDRYTVHVDVRPFTSKNGQLISFVVVKRIAKKPVGYTGDLDQLGVFVMTGSGSAIALVNYESVAAGEINKTIKFSSGNLRHVIWQRGDKWYISNYETAQTKEVGSTPSKADTLQLINPDLLFSYDEKKRFFVNGWNRVTQALTLTETPENFPPKDQKIAKLGTLKELTEATEGASKKDNHAIIDTALVPEVYRT